MFLIAFHLAGLTPVQVSYISTRKSGFRESREGGSENYPACPAVAQNVISLNVCGGYERSSAGRKAAYQQPLLDRGGRRPFGNDKELACGKLPLPSGLESRACVSWAFFGAMGASFCWRYWRFEFCSRDSEPRGERCRCCLRISPSSEGRGVDL